jgi:hypothetical protein
MLVKTKPFCKRLAASCNPVAADQFCPRSRSQ